MNEYHLKDHIGNVRVAIIDDNGTPKVIQESDYYPFGLRFGEQRIRNDSKYLFSGKKQQDEVVAGVSLDWYDFGARMYSAELGRRHAADPANQFFSPYVGIGNNPINGYDPDGMIYQEMAKGSGGNSGGSSSSSGSKKKKKGIGEIFQEKLNDVKEGLGNFTGWIGDELVPGFDVTNSNSEISRFGNWMWNTGFPALDPTYPQIDRFGDYEYDYPSAFYNLLCIQHWIVPLLIEDIIDRFDKTDDDCDQIIIKGGYGYTGNADEIDPESVVFFNNAVIFDIDKQLPHTCVTSVMEYLSNVLVQLDINLSTGF